MIKRTLLKIYGMTAITVLLAVGSAYAGVGMNETRIRREHGQPERLTRGSQNDQTGYQQIQEYFLNKDYAAVDRLAGEYIGRGYDQPDMEDVLTLQALSLLKLGRGPEARAKFQAIEDHSASEPNKARAAASIADSYLDENDLPAAYDQYRQVLSKYPGSDQTEYISQKIKELSPRVAEPSIAKPVTKISYDERHFYSIQVGSFSDPRNAQNLLGKLIRRNYDAYLAPDERRRRHRVRVGRLNTLQEARTLEMILRREGYPTKIL